MRLSVFGLGYVGCISAACFARDGHVVIGVDVNPLKVDIINSGRSPIVEPEIEELILAAVKCNRLRATTGAAEAVSASDISLICVGTPGKENGSLDLSHVEGVCREIGEALISKEQYHLVVIRSTMLPGTIEKVVLPTLEFNSGKKGGKDFGVAINPEFLREGSSVSDFENPPFTLIGANEEDASGPLRRLYSQINAPTLVVGIKEAEMVKYTCNAFHGLKVAFANEIGTICKALGVDSHKVMDVFCSDAKLNISPSYLKPGFAFGGSCLPKDLRAITYKAKELDSELPVLNAVLASNQLHVERAVRMVLRTGRRNVGVLGLSFKEGTDDLRESPMVTLIEQLIGKGLQLAIYDRDVELARVFGANKEFIEREIPHISSLMLRDLDEVIAKSEVVVIGKRAQEFRELLESSNRKPLIIDLVGLFQADADRTNYQGICW